MESLLWWGKFAGAVIAALVSLGVVAAIGYFAKALWDRRRWRVFAGLVEDWARTDFRALDDLPPDRWKTYVANWLIEAEFTPSEVIRYLDLAVLFARARQENVLKEEGG